jgi:predicted LPLAT superfamily acyltransferase
MEEDGSVAMQFKSEAPVAAFVMDDGGKLAILGTETGRIEVCRPIP